MKIGVKRVYEAVASDDGLRILVDRLWPRGLSKESARIDFWAREVAPSNELRRWYGHDPAKWPEFRRRYCAEMDANPAAVAELLGRIGEHRASFLYSSKEEKLNNAVVLREYVESRRKRGS